jgi:hypothetical protein
MIDPSQVLSEEPTAVTPHGGICGGESQQWLSYPTKPHAGICAGGRRQLLSLVRCAVSGGRSYPPDGEESGEPASSLWRTTRAVDPAPLFHAPLFSPDGILGRAAAQILCTRSIDAERLL